MKTKRFSDWAGLGVIAAFFILLTAACHGRRQHGSLGGINMAGFAGQSLSISAKASIEADDAAQIPQIHPNQEGFTPNIPPVSAND
jgi:hypothetical protein